MHRHPVPLQKFRKLPHTKIRRIRQRRPNKLFARIRRQRAMHRILHRPRPARYIRLIPSAQSADPQMIHDTQPGRPRLDIIQFRRFVWLPR